MKTLLYLVHRLPYPPNKGDKISSFNLLKFFAKHYRVYLGCFIDDPNDLQYRDAVREYCVDACFVELNPRRAKFASLRGLLTGEPLTLPFYRSAKLQRWLDGVLRERPPDAVLVYSGAPMQYLLDQSGQRRSAFANGTRILFDLEDVDSEKWRQYAPTKPWPLSWLYRREGERLLAFERRAAAASDACVLISNAEAELFRTLAPTLSDKIAARTQGVDSAYFDPALGYDNPYPATAKAVVFTGVMDYWPNVDAVCWFVEAVWPVVRAALPDARFYIVGMNPSDSVQKLNSLANGVTVTGAVDDIRPYLAHAAAVTVPLRIARGIQNKVLEAMAMARPIVASRAAMTGIEVTDAMLTRVIETDDKTGAGGDNAAAVKLAQTLIALLQNGQRADPAARDNVLARYDWDANLRRMQQLLEQTA